MANPTSIAGDRFAVLVATTTEASVAINPALKYSIAHSGQDAAGIASSVTVYLSNVAAVDADASEGGDKMILLDRATVPLAAGRDTLKFRTAAGEATLLVAVD